MEESTSLIKCSVAVAMKPAQAGVQPLTRDSS